MHREGVHQLVREKHARDRVSRYCVQVRYPGDIYTRVREFKQALFLRFDHGRAPFHQEVPQAGEEVRLVAPIRIQQMLGEEPFAGPHLHDRELARRNNCLGRLRDLPADQLGEDGMHVKTRVVIPLKSDARSGRHVVAEFRVIERRLHEGGKGNGAVPLDTGDQFFDQPGMTEVHRRSAANL